MLRQPFNCVWCVFVKIFYFSLYGSVQPTMMPEGAIFRVAKRLGYNNIKYKIMHICKSITICTSFNTSFTGYQFSLPAVKNLIATLIVVSFFNVHVLILVLCILHFCRTGRLSHCYQINLQLTLIICNQ